MLDHDPIGLWIATSAAAGVAAHVAIASFYRRSYRRLRGAYSDAIADVQRTSGAPDALVRAHELQRQFAHAHAPSWLEGLGAHFRAAFVLGAIASLALAVAAHRLPPVLVGVVILLAIGLRRILLATVLLLAVFAATHLCSLSRDESAAAARAREAAAPAVSRSPRGP